MRKAKKRDWHEQPEYIIYSVCNGYTQAATRVSRRTVQISAGAALCAIIAMSVGGYHSIVAANDRALSHEHELANLKSDLAIAKFEKSQAQAVLAATQQNAETARDEINKMRVNINAIQAGWDVDSRRAKTLLAQLIADLDHAKHELGSITKRRELAEGAHFAAVNRAEQCEIRLTDATSKIEELDTRATQLQARLDSEKAYSTDVVRWARGLKITQERSVERAQEVADAARRLTEDSLKALSGGLDREQASVATRRTLVAACSDLSRALESTTQLPIGNPVGTQTATRAAAGGSVALSTEIGTAIKATAAGRVTFAGRAGRDGLVVEIDHGRQIITRYRNLASLAVKQGDRIPSGASIGHIANRDSGGQLKYEIVIEGQTVDPEEAIRRGGAIRAVLEEHRRNLQQMQASLAKITPPEVPASPR